MYKLKYFILIVTTFLSSCDPALRSFVLTSTNDKVTCEFEIVKLNNSGDMVPLREFASDKKGKESIDSVLQNSRVKNSFEKYGVKLDYSFSYDTLIMFWRIEAPDIEKINAFLFDVGFKQPNMQKKDFDISFNTTKDSAQIQFRVKASAFIYHSYISVETPTDKTVFSPSKKVECLTPNKVSPTKMEYYFNPVSDTFETIITVNFKRDEIPFKLNQDPSLPDSNSIIISNKNKGGEEKENTFLGIINKKWEFIGLILGIVASIVAVIAFIISLVKTEKTK